MSEAQLALDYWKREHNQSSTVPPRDEQPHRYDLAEYIASLSPTPYTILELGCSSARNLAILKRYLPNAELIGIEPNDTTYNAAKRAHGDYIELHKGDASLLDQFVDNAFDVVFTCSVCDHIPAPEWRGVYDEMVRVARYHIVLLEPIMAAVMPFHNYELDREQRYLDCDVRELNIAAAQFSYVHDYLGHDRHLRLVRDLPIDAPQWAQFGSLYRLLHRING